MSTKRIVLCCIAGVLLFIALIFFIASITFIDKHELGFQYDQFTGELTRLDRTGYVIRNPIRYSVHTIDLRPYQLSITALPNGGGNSDVARRVLNAKLVQFNPDGLDAFIAWHGREAGDDLNNLLEIMKCYAFDSTDGRDCPFITIIGTLSPEQAGQP